jgi:transcriptional regulator with XRE-family HTH domain
MKDRIAQFLVKENISPAEFADKIGVQRSSVSHVLNERNYPSASFIQKMLTSYKNLNPRWLLLGEGDMLDTPIKNKPEPSLFAITQSRDYQEKIGSSQMADKIIRTNIPNKEDTQEKISEPKPLQPPISNIQTQEVHEIIGKTFENKEVERIVLFYKDKTFAAYTPSK